MAEKKTTKKVQAETKERKPRKSKEEIIKELDDKIAYHQRCIQTLTEKKDAAMQSSKKQQIKEVLSKAEKSGLSIEEIAEKLNIEL